MDVCMGKETAKKEDRSTRRNPAPDGLRRQQIFFEEITGSPVENSPECQTS